MHRPLHWLTYGGSHINDKSKTVAKFRVHECKKEHFVPGILQTFSEMRASLETEITSLWWATCSFVSAGRCIWPQAVPNRLPAVLLLQAFVFDCCHYRISYVQVRAYSLLYLTTHITNWIVTSHLWNATTLLALWTLNLIIVIQAHTKRAASALRGPAF